MMAEQKRHAFLLFVVFVSLFGLIVLTIMLELPMQPGIEFGGRRELIAFIYGLICLAGSLTVFFPGPCSRVFGLRQSTIENLTELNARATRVGGVLLFHGHHSVRDDGSAIHEFQLGKKNFCASCFGLLMGAVLSILAMTIFVLSGWTDGYFARVLYFVGVGAVVVGLVFSVISVSTWTKFILGAVFVVGTCAMLIAAEAATASLTEDLLVILLSVFWLLSRVSLSHRDRLQATAG